MKLLFIATLLAGTTLAAELPRIEWQKETQHLLVPGGVYGRITKLVDGVWLACSQSKRACVVLRSADEGKTWSSPQIVASFEHGIAANPELCALSDGGVLLFWNERPQPDGGAHAFTIRMSCSRDGGRTWQARDEPVFRGGNVFASACWEPAAVQMPEGEVRLFFAHELPGQQEIAEMHSTDYGQTWSLPKQASLRPKHRDGMPVPCLLKDGTLALSIEDNGISGQERKHPPFRPSIVMPDTSKRRIALAEEPGDTFNIAAPYLARFPDGITLLSAQSNQDEPRWHRMVVYVGNEQAQDFTQRTLPFGLPSATNLEWNSLFIANDHTVIAITSGTIEGKHGLWMIRGKR
jgi:BNR/Asp-box repeat